jgi:hypothetical protein
VEMDSSNDPSDHVYCIKIGDPTYSTLEGILARSHVANVEANQKYCDVVLEKSKPLYDNSTMLFLQHPHNLIHKLFILMQPLLQSMRTFQSYHLEPTPGNLTPDEWLRIVTMLRNHRISPNFDGKFLDQMLIKKRRNGLNEVTSVDISKVFSCVTSVLELDRFGLYAPNLKVNRFALLGGILGRYPDFRERK